MFCYCNNIDILDSEVLHTRIDYNCNGDEFFIKTIKDTCICKDCGSFFENVYELETLD